MSSPPASPTPVEIVADAAPESTPEVEEAASPVQSAEEVAAAQQQQQQQQAAATQQQMQLLHHQQQQQILHQTHDGQNDPSLDEQAAAHAHAAAQHAHLLHQQHAAGGMLAYGGMPGVGVVGGEMDEFDHASLLAALASNQMMLSQQQRAEQDAINAQAQQSVMPIGGNVEICRAYLAGRCSRGAACRFVHVENGTGHQPPNPHLCRDWLNGTCIRGSNCRFQHQGVSGSKASIHSGTSKSGPWSGPGGVKTVICHQWASRGRCDYGTACKFAHQRLGGGAHGGAGVGVGVGGDRWNESALDEKKLLAAMLSGLSPQEALSQALNSLQNSNPQKFGGPVAAGAANPPNAAAAAAATAVAGSDPNSPSQQAQQAATAGTDAQAQQAAQAQQQQAVAAAQQQQLAGVMGSMGPQLVSPQKRADGSLIMCRFYARHGWCKYGVACKFHHQPVPPQMFPPSAYARDPMGMLGGGPAGAPNQSLASLLALGLKASMMSNDHLIANHAALLAASMNQPPGVTGPPRMGSPVQMMGAQMPPLDPALVNVVASYLQQQQQQQPQSNANLAALLQQLQGGTGAAGPHANGNGSISPTQLQGFDGHAGGFGGPAGQDAAFQAFLQQQHQAAQQQSAFQNAFSPAAASAFNAIPNLNSSSANGAASGPQGASQAGAGGNGQATPNGLSLPQMISTAFRSTSGGVAGPTGSGSGASSLSNNLSLMSLKPFGDDAATAFTDDHQRSNSSSFNDAQSSFSSPSLLNNEQRAAYEYGGLQQQSSSAGASGSQIIGPSSLNGSPNASTLSALFSSSLNAPFMH